LFEKSIDSHKGKDHGIVKFDLVKAVRVDKFSRENQV
jgi:hypothetical protein